MLVSDHLAALEAGARENDLKIGILERAIFRRNTIIKEDVETIRSQQKQITTLEAAVKEKDEIILRNDKDAGDRIAERWQQIAALTAELGHEKEAVGILIDENKGLTTELQERKEQKDDLLEKLGRQAEEIKRLREALQDVDKSIAELENCLKPSGGKAAAMLKEAFQIIREIAQAALDGGQNENNSVSE
jgi:chromosome segregation ATPase